MRTTHLPVGNEVIWFLPKIASMKRVSAYLLTSLLVLGGLAGSSLAQDPLAPNSGNSDKSSKRAAIEGIVTRDPDSQPVKKAVIELIAENQSQGGDYTAVSGADGAFRIENIVPGRYRLFAERVGLLNVGKNHSRSEGRVLTLTEGQQLKDLHIRLQAAAVVRGRVTDEDGDPMSEAEVTILRQNFISGHPHWEQAGAERTNDLGEFRIANLPAGNVYVSVSPPPDFKTLIEANGAAASETHNAEKPTTTYQTSYYPGTSDRSQATPIQLHSGDDFPVNFSLMPAPSLSIRGSVVNLPPHSAATIMLQSRDFNVVQNGAEMHKDGSFVIRDVSPGNYTILASVDGSSVPLTARQSLLVGATSVDGVRLSPQPGALIHGRLRLESRGAVASFDSGQVFLTLQSVNPEDEADSLGMGDRFTNLTHVAADGSFEWKDVPPGNYYVQLMGEGVVNEDWFVKSVLAGGREVNDSGLSATGAVSLDVVVSTNGGVIDGIVVDSKGEPVANTTVVAVPESRMRARVDRFRKTVSDQSGRFILRGLRPGDYTLFAWESVDGEAYFNPDFLKGFEGQGMAFRVGDGERKSVQVPLIPALDEP